MSYEIKKKYDDFIVIEIPNANIKIEDTQESPNKITQSKKGLIALMIKKDIDFYKAKHHLENYAKFTFNGIKDKTALTYQLIEINKILKPIQEDNLIEIKSPKQVEKLLDFMQKKQEHIELEDLYIPEKNIAIIPLFYAQNKVFPGNLEKNYFIINLYSDDEIKIEQNQENKKTQDFTFINYFDKQRFGKNNLEISKLILKKQFNKVIEKLKEEYNFLENTNDLNKIRDVLKIILNSYQSYIFNKTISEYIKQNYPKNLKKITILDEEYFISNEIDQKEFPLIGFDSRKEILNKKYEDIIYDLIEKDKITFRDLIIRELRNLSMDHSFRNSKVTTSLKIQRDNNKYTFQFFIEKGSYATMLIKQYYELNKDD
ncbi:MAG: tRNA pseudouridine(13) synthase TruD [Candidatus Nanoarchaeia archaeon]|nr:tRNA pseudouridine(13) synthase TruD [Candidatus Nanoarchaeia archaeon]